MAWKPGESGNPSGRPLEGRSLALGLLDKICAEAGTRELFETALRARLGKDPLAFYREFVVALAPKDHKVVLPERGWATLTPAEACAAMDAATVPNPGEVEPTGGTGAVVEAEEAKDE